MKQFIQEGGLVAWIATVVMLSGLIGGGIGFYVTATAKEMISEHSTEAHSITDGKITALKDGWSRQAEIYREMLTEIRRDIDDITERVLILEQKQLTDDKINEIVLSLDKKVDILIVLVEGVKGNQSDLSGVKDELGVMKTDISIIKSKLGNR